MVLPVTGMAPAGTGTQDSAVMGLVASDSPAPPRRPAPPSGSGGPALPPSRPPAPPTLPPPPGAAGPPTSRPTATAAEAKELVAPVSGTATAQPAALIPQEAQQKRPQVRRQPPTRKLQPGDLVCGECGEGNSVTRKFCSRCGTSLAEAEVVRTPWWRKLLPGRGAKVRKSGERSKRRGRAGKTKLGVFVSTTIRTVRRFVALALVVAGVAYGLFAPFRGWANQRVAEVKGTVERMFFPQYAPVSAGEAPVASVALPDHPADLALDGKSNTFWAAPVGGAEPNMVVKFDRKVDLAKIIVHNGDGGAFKDTYRAEKLHLVFNNGKTTDVSLQDKPDPQTLEIDSGEGINSVEIHVVSTFKSVTGTSLAVSEIEFFEEL
ncbi:NADase-type glycan-binding domain-containing protein [Actinophytocola sp.]|uniref:zinc ribbon domain-containing protein n=1 Tax=Actinophytocola sp. TaxID=1872138 RepID=UPI00389980C1